MIHVEHHDKSVRDFHFQNLFSYDLACLTERGAMFGASAAAASTSELGVANSSIEFWATGAIAPSWRFKFGASEAVKGEFRKEIVDLIEL